MSHYKGILPGGGRVQLGVPNILGEGAYDTGSDECCPNKDIPLGQLFLQRDVRLWVKCHGGSVGAAPLQISPRLWDAV